MDQALGLRVEDSGFRVQGTTARNLRCPSGVPVLGPNYAAASRSSRRLPIPKRGPALRV